MVLRRTLSLKLSLPLKCYNNLNPSLESLWFGSYSLLLEKHMNLILGGGRIHSGKTQKGEVKGTDDIIVLSIVCPGATKSKSYKISS